MELSRSASGHNRGGSPRAESQLLHTGAILDPGANEPSRIALAVQMFVSVCFWWLAAVIVTLLFKRVVDPIDGLALYPFPFALTGFINISACILVLLLYSAAQCQFYVQGGSPANALVVPDGHALRKLLLVGLIQGIEIACTNKALAFVSVAARTVLNSLGVLFVMVIAWAWGLERLDFLRLVAGGFLTIGGVLQGLDTRTGEPMSKSERIGFALVLVALCLSAQRWALLQNIMQQSPLDSAIAKMSKLQLMCCYMPVTGVVCMGLSAIFEYEALRLSTITRVDLVVVVVGMSCAVLTLCWAELRIVELTSAVALSVLASLHLIPLVLAGILINGDTVGKLSASGFGSCIIGALVYRLARLSDGSGREERAGKDAEAWSADPWSADVNE